MDYDYDLESTLLNSGRLAHKLSVIHKRCRRECTSKYGMKCEVKRPIFFFYFGGRGDRGVVWWSCGGRVGS